MKKKNGFTLIETMGVLILLSVILLLIFPTVTKWLKSAEDSIDDATKDLIIVSAKDYVDESELSIFKKNSYEYCLSLEEIINKGYISSESVNKLDSLDWTVKVTYNKGKSNYEIVKECSIKTE